MKPYLYINDSMGLPDRGMAFMSKIQPLKIVPEEIRASGWLWDHPGNPPSQATIPLALKASCRTQRGLNGLGANVRRPAVVTPPPCRGLMRWVEINNNKWGRATLPLVLRRCRRHGTALALLSPPFPAQKWNCTGTRDDGHQMRPCRDRTMEDEGLAVWFPLDERRRGESSMGFPFATGQSLSGYDAVTWIQVGPFAPWRDAWQARKRGPPNVVLNHWWRDDQAVESLSLVDEPMG